MFSCFTFLNILDYKRLFTWQIHLEHYTLYDPLRCGIRQNITSLVIKKKKSQNYYEKLVEGYPKRLAQVKQISYSIKYYGNMDNFN